MFYRKNTNKSINSLSNSASNKRPSLSNRHIIKKSILSLFVSTLFISLGFTNILQVNANQNNSPVNFSHKSTVSLKNNQKQKPRIAVLDFDYSNVASNWLWWWRSSAKGVSDILVNKLVEGGNFRVIERSKLNAILAEQNLGASGRVDASSAAQIGRILGVETVVIGSITEFNISKSGGGVRLPGLGRVGGRKTKANVKLNLRLVNTSTAEILLTAQADGQSSNSGGAISLPGGIGVDTSSRKEAKLITNAIVKAIDKAAEKINNNSHKISTNNYQTAPAVNAIVADVSANTIILNKGTANGYVTGTKLSVERVTRVVKDPSTGKVIRKITKRLGTIKITEADAQSSVAQIISGRGLKVGDIAKPMK